jgi:hypothetical protein
MRMEAVACASARSTRSAKALTELHARVLNPGSEPPRIEARMLPPGDVVAAVDPPRERRGVARRARCRAVRATAPALGGDRPRRPADPHRRTRRSRSPRRACRLAEPGVAIESGPPLGARPTPPRIRPGVSRRRRRRDARRGLCDVLANGLAHERRPLLREPVRGSLHVDECEIRNEALKPLL